jgi:hypothetical protein
LLKALAGPVLEPGKSAIDAARSSGGVYETVTGVAPFSDTRRTLADCTWLLASITPGTKIETYLAIRIRRIFSCLSFASFRVLLVLHGVGRRRCLGFGLIVVLGLAVSFALTFPSTAFLLLRLLLMRFAPGFPGLLSFGYTLEELFVVFWSALFTPVMLGNLIIV